MGSSKLSYPAILLISINSIMGTGIYFLPSVGAQKAGLFAIISWIIMGFIALYYSTIFGELVSRYPKEGGVYEYAKEAFGFFPSFLLGWISLIAANITIAMLMVGAIKYIAPYISNFATSILGVVFILIFNFIAFKGLKTGKVMLLTFAGITLSAVLGIIIPGLLNFNPSNFADWTAHSAFTSLDAGLGGILSGTFIVITTIFFISETFFGWETTTFLAEQVDNPKKVMPKAFVKGTLIIFVVVILFVVASQSVLHWSSLATASAPLAQIASNIYGPVGVPIYSILVYLAIIGSVAGWIVAAPNLLVALSKDKLFPPSFAKLHRKNKTPYKAIAFQTIVTSLLVFVGAGSYEALLHLLVPLLLVMYVSVVFSLIRIRRKHPSFDGYKAPGGKWGPIILVSITFLLIGLWVANEPGALSTLGLIVSFILIGIPIFFLMNFHHNPHSTLTFRNKTIELSRILERFFLPRYIRKRLLKQITSFKSVLFLGAGSGLLLKESKLPPTNVQVIEHTKTLTTSLRKRHPKYNIMYDPHGISRVHPSISKTDLVVSIGLLSMITDLPSFLKHLASIVPENGRIRFVDYSEFYMVIPNKIPSPKLLQSLFREAGFAVSVEKKKGLLWSFIIVEGIRTDNSRVFV
ncbi:MAG: amino acid permease [Nanobdellota archaeon]